MLFYVNTVKEGRVNSFDEIARTADKDVSQTSESVERGEELIGSLH